MIAMAKRRQLVAWIGALALLGNVLAGVFGLGALKGPLQITDDVLGALVICTAHGPQESLDGNGGAPGHKPGEHCPACVTLAKVALAVVLAFVGIVFTLPSVLRPARESICLLPLRLGLAGIGSRAPPHFA